MSVAPPSKAEGPLALICGGGSLPLAVADSVTARGRAVLLFPLRGFAAPADFAGREPHWVHLGQFGTVARIARANGCRDIVCLGSVVRPSLWQLRPDFFTLKVLPQVAKAFRGGDDHLLSSVGRVIEQHGFRLLGAHEVAPEILVPAGALGRAQPSARHLADIELGFDYLRAAGPFDVGQAVVVADKRVLAVEAAEGTDQMLVRIAQLRESGRIKTPMGAGVLVKAPKPSQDRRFDLPSIGPQTVEGAARAGLAGIAVASGETVIAEPDALVAAADRVEIFVVGVAAGAKR
jgi:UDP-2,3-diacylglucosamine hydrolase